MNIIHVCIGLLMRKVLKKARIQVKSTLSYLSKRVVKLDHIDLFFLTQCPLWACHSQYWATMVPLNLGHHHSSINKNGIWKKKIKHMLIQLSFFAIRILSKHVHVNQLSRLNPGNYVIFATSIIFFISINNRYEIFVH